MTRKPHLILLPLAAALLLGLAACERLTVTDNEPPVAEKEPEVVLPADHVKPVTGIYAIDPAHTMVLAQWSHFGFSNPSANFGDADGRIVINAANMSASSVDVTLPLSGLASFSADFDQHLRGADFFDAAAFPVAHFASTKVTPLGADRYEVTGELTIKGQSRVVVLDAKLNGAGEHPMTQVPSLGLDATTTVKRSDFGLGLHAPMVSDEVTLRITSEASRVDDSAKP
ncbi:YceI family protein [Luteimonas sp. e5]